MRERSCAVGLIGVVCIAAGAASPTRAAQPEKTGWSAGFGLGGSYVSWTWEDGDRRQEGSGAANARIAYAIEPDVLLGIEWWGWAKDYEIGSTPEDVPAEILLWAATAAVTYFPDHGGFFLRGGLGLAYGSAAITPPPSVAFPVSGDASDTGFSMLAAVGYEAGVTSRMALGGAVHVVYLYLGEDEERPLDYIESNPFDNTFGYGLTVQFNWYW